jgi:hypothetical protein
VAICGDTSIIKNYDALLNLAAEAQTALSDMTPRDMIDIQSFIWTVVEYKEEDRPAPA